MPSTYKQKRTRLIDTIPEFDDTVSVPQEWTWLMTPYIYALDLPSSVVVSGNLYVDTEAGNSQIIYAKSLLGTVGTLSLAKGTENTKETLNLLRSTPGIILLLGDPGVGKTTWVQHFFNLPDVCSTNEHFYFDGRETYSALVDLAPVDYLKAKIREGIIKTTQKACRRLNLSHEINNIGEPYKIAHTLEVESIVHSAVIECMNKGIQIWLILDNFDRLERVLQNQVIDYSKNAYTQLGLRSIVPVRPYTLQGRILHDLRCVTLSPPSLEMLLRKRADYAIESQTASEIVNQFERGLSVNLSWTQGVIDTRDKLLTLYKNVGSALAESTVFTKCLSSIHAHDLHYILHELRELCTSGYFCRIMIERLSGQKRSESELISAYMRGHYYHHRAKYHSGENIVNLFDTGPDTKHRFLAIRILQLVDRYDRGDSDGIPAQVLVDKLTTLGFTSEYIISTIEYLMKHRLLIEISRFADWDSGDFKLNLSDRIKLSLTGRYYLDCLLKNTRYIECMTHVTRLLPSIIDNMAKRTRTAEDSFKNISFLLKDVGGVILQDLKDMKPGVKVKFLQELDHQQGFFYSATTECLRRVEKLNSEGKLSDDIVGSFNELSQIAQNIIDIKTRMSQS